MWFAFSLDFDVLFFRNLNCFCSRQLQFYFRRKIKPFLWKRLKILQLNLFQTEKKKNFLLILSKNRALLYLRYRKTFQNKSQQIDCTTSKQFKRRKYDLSLFYTYYWTTLTFQKQGFLCDFQIWKNNNFKKLRTKFHLWFLFSREKCKIMIQYFVFWYFKQRELKIESQKVFIKSAKVLGAQLLALWYLDCLKKNQRIAKLVTQIAENYKLLVVESKPKKNSRKTKVRKITLATRKTFHIEPMIFVVPSMNVTLPVRDACQDNNTTVLIC